MKKRKRPSWGAMPLMGAIPTATGPIKIKNAEYEDSKTLIARLQREEAEAREAPVTAAINELSKTMVQLRAAKADALFKIPSEDLAAVTTATPDNVAGSVGEIRAQIKTAFDDALAQLAQSGVTLHDSGTDKMRKVSRLNVNVDWRVSSNWVKLYELMNDLNVFAGPDVTAPQPVFEETPAPKPTLDELLATVSAESTDGRKTLVEAVTDSVLTGEFRTCWQAFIASISENFGYVFTEAEKKLIYDTMVRRNLSFKLPRHYDLVRVALTQAGSLPQHLLYPAERLALDVENADLNDREVRREFARRTHLLADQRVS
jgi:hypothetical protein